MLTGDQRRAFEVEGLVHVPAAVAPVDAIRMCNEVWKFLKVKQGIVRDNPSTWTESRPTGFAPLSRSKGFDRFWSPVVSEILTEVFAQPRQSRERARVLMTFPQSDKAWSVPSVGWHFDFAPLQERPGLRAAQVFGLLSPIRPTGGGTLVLTGSHRLVARYVAETKQPPKPARVRAWLSEAHPWLKELWGGGTSSSTMRIDRYLGRPIVLDDVELRVVEVQGEPGDVYMMNSDCFHAIAPNSLTAPRVMLTSLVTRTAERA